MRFSFAVVPMLAVSACGDLDLKSVRPPEVVPAALEGEWAGTWQSVSSTANGPVTLRVQQFDGEPVVSLLLDNQCLTAREYELVLTPALIELRAGGETVLAGTLDGDQALVGTYQCAADIGTWRVTWQRPLPTIADLRGRWTGALSVAGFAEVPLQVQLDQRVRAGTIVIDAVAELVGAWPEPIAFSGSATFREAGFDLLLLTPSGVAPQLLLTAFGNREPLRIDVGLLQVLSPGLPFQQALVQLAWQHP